jgi:hypothetical protein
MPTACLLEFLALVERTKGNVLVVTVAQRNMEEVMVLYVPGFDPGSEFCLRLQLYETMSVTERWLES